MAARNFFTVPRLHVSTHTTNNIYIIGYDDFGLGTAGIFAWYSTNGGNSFTKTTLRLFDSQGVGQVFNPHANLAETRWLISAAFNPDGLFLSTTGITGTFNQVTLSIPPVTGPVFSPEGITESPSTDGLASYVCTGDSRLFRLAGGVANVIGLLPAPTFDGLTTGHGFGGWPYNNNQIQLSSLAKMWQSTDGGVSWIEKTGNAADFCVSTRVFRNLVPIWIE